MMRALQRAVVLGGACLAMSACATHHTHSHHWHHVHAPRIDRHATPQPPQQSARPVVVLRERAK